MMDYVLLLGLLGMALILLAFVLNVFGRIDAHEHEFLFLNLFGSLILVIYAIYLRSAPFLILNSVWSVAAIWGLLHHTRVVHGRR